MIKKIKQLIEGDSPDQGQKITTISEQELAELVSSLGPREPDLRTLGIFTDVAEDKCAELVHALLYLDEMNTFERDPKKYKPIQFYISTYGGSADDMFGLYDVMRQVRERTEIHTIGVGKVMSAGVLILAAGTNGKRKIGKNCRVMIHSVIGGNHGSLHNMVNEMEAIEQLQEMYCDALIAETKMTKKQLKKMLERKVNVYLSAEEAVELGIADIII